MLWWWWRESGCGVGCMMQMGAYMPLKGVLTHLWLLWEIVLLAEPLLVVGTTPGAHPPCQSVN